MKAPIPPRSAQNPALVRAGVASELLALVKDFLRDAERAGRSRHTVKNYRSDLLRFCRFVEAQGQALTPALLRVYLASFDGKAVTTRSRHFAVLRGSKELKGWARKRRRWKKQGLEAARARLGRALDASV